MILKMMFRQMVDISNIGISDLREGIHYDIEDAIQNNCGHFLHWGV